jgi:hypothetical protein
MTERNTALNPPADLCGRHDVAMSYGLAEQA